MLTAAADCLRQSAWCSPSGSRLNPVRESSLGFGVEFEDLNLAPASASSESASALLNLRADPELQARIDELRGKAYEGTLTPAEEAEYKDVVEAIDIVSIMQAKARSVLSPRAA